MLNCSNSRNAISEAISKYDAQELEDAIAYHWLSELCCGLKIMEVYIDRVELYSNRILSGLQKKRR
jgi:hypothetical protein